MGRAGDVNEVLLESISLCKKNKATFVTPIISLVFTFIPFLLGIWAYVSLFQTKISLIGLAVLVLMVTMYLRSFFSIMQSWVIANTVWEEKAKISEGFKRALKLSGEVITYSLTILIVGLINQSLTRGKKNILADLIKKPFEGITEDVWEVTSHLTLPSMTITKNKFSDGLQEVKKGMTYVPQIKIKDLGLEYFTYPIVFIALLLSIFLGWWYYPSLGVLVFLSVVLIIFLVQTYIKTTYYTVLYIWMGEQIQRKKNKKSLETRVPPILENYISVKLE